MCKVVDLPHTKAYAMLRLDFRDGPRAVHFSMRRYLLYFLSREFSVKKKVGEFS